MSVVQRTRSPTWVVAWWHATAWCTPPRTCACRDSEKKALEHALHWLDHMDLRERAGALSDGALQIADRGYVLENGRLVLEDTGANLLKNDAVRKAYLGG